METKTQTRCAAVEILVVPFHGQGHILPSAHLSLRLAARNLRTTLLLPSSHPSPPQLPLLRITHLPPPSSTADPGVRSCPLLEMDDGPFEDYLSHHQPRPDFVVLDIMMHKLAPVFRRFGVPVICLFTSGAFSAALNHAVFAKNGDTIALPGDLSEDVIADFSRLCLHHRHHPPPPPPPPNGGAGGVIPRFGPPRPTGSPPPWLDGAEGSIAVLVNTTTNLEGPYLDYIARAVGKPVWGVGPLLPAAFWEISSSPPPSDGDSVLSWLDSKPARSVVYIAFGTEVSPSPCELRALAAALEESDQFYVWVRRRHRHSHHPHPPHHVNNSDEEADEKEVACVTDKGMVVRGWAPQLAILRHPSTGAFVTHCGWNSTFEALACGVPMLCWPIRGDQPYNARLIAGQLKVGHMVQGGGEVRKEEIVKGIVKVLGDGEARERAGEIRGWLKKGFPARSSSSLDAFCDFVKCRESIDNSDYN